MKNIIMLFRTNYMDPAQERRIKNRKAMIVESIDAAMQAKGFDKVAPEADADGEHAYRIFDFNAGDDVIEALRKGCLVANDTIVIAGKKFDDETSIKHLAEALLSLPEKPAIFFCSPEAHMIVELPPEVKPVFPNRVDRIGDQVTYLLKSEGRPDVKKPAASAATPAPGKQG